MSAQTLYDKLWQSHTVYTEEDGTTAQLATRFSVEGFVSAWAGAMGWGLLRLTNCS